MIKNLKLRITNCSPGFTLVELLISIAIMATLMAILLPNFMGARERARDAQKIQDIGAMKNALRIYYNDRQAYPTGTATMLDDTFSSYMTNTLNLGYTYSYTQQNSGDGFIISIGLEAGSGNDDTDSQVKCGLGTTTDKIYTVCAR